MENYNICNNNKYERHPKQIPIEEVQIPKKNEGEQLHSDIFSLVLFNLERYARKYERYIEEYLR